MRKFSLYFQTPFFCFPLSMEGYGADNSQTVLCRNLPCLLTLVRYASASDLGGLPMPRQDYLRLAIQRIAKQFDKCRNQA